MRKVTAFVMAAVLTVMGSVAAAQEFNAQAFNTSTNAPGNSSKTVQSNTALPFMVDIEKTAGWMIYLEGGYQWNIFRGAGLRFNGAPGSNISYENRRNYTEGGVAGAIALGYNFCPKFPLTVGIKFGMGPSNKLEHNDMNPQGVGTRYWERIGLYRLDFAIDYDFKNKSKVTPFVGLNAGVAIVSQKARAWHNTGATEYFGKYDTHRRINFLGGVRTGIKYDVNPRVALTFFGQYSYLGSIKGRNFEMSNGADTLSASTTKIKTHVVDAKVGVRIAF